MLTFVIDEDMPRSTAIALREAGHLAIDVRDVGLRGHSDAEVFAYAQAQDAILVTADKGFSNVLVFPPGSHAGIIVMRVPNELSTRKVNEVLLKTIAQLEDEVLKGLLVVVEPGRIRMRRRPPTAT